MLPNTRCHGNRFFARKGIVITHLTLQLRKFLDHLRDEIGFGAHYVTHPLTRAGFERLAAGRAADKETVADLNTLDGRAYLERFDVQAKLSTAVAAVLKEHPANPLLAIAELLSKSK